MSHHLLPCLAAKKPRTQESTAQANPNGESPLNLDVRTKEHINNTKLKNPNLIDRVIVRYGLIRLVCR